MNLITINTKAISGALFNDKPADRNLFVGKGEKSPVIMTGYVGANEVEGEDGEYTATAYGRLQLEAALAGTGDKQRLVLSIAGGALRGVLFKAKEGAKFDYQGNIEAGDGLEYPVFGRKVKGERGTFISLSSMDKEKREERDNGKGSHSNASAKPDAGMPDDDVPF